MVKQRVFWRACVVKGIALSLVFGAYGCGGKSGGASASLLKPSNLPEQVSDIRNQALDIQQHIRISELKTPAFKPSYPDAHVQQKMQEVLEQTNLYRKEKGLAPLELDDNLSVYAHIRAYEITELFKHTRPDGTNPLDVDRYFEGESGAIGENLASGQATSKHVAQEWRNSPTHYAAMVNPEYNRIGIGYYYSPETVAKHHWTQIFAGGDVQSIYAYTTPTTRHHVEQTIAQMISYQENGALNVVGASNAHREKLAIVGVIDAAQNRVMLQDVGQHRWVYQRFGEVVAQDGSPLAYVNVGRSFIPEKDSLLKAQYVGEVIGDVGQHSRTRAKLAAELDYGQTKKQLRISVFDTEIANNDLLQATPTSYSPARHLDFNETLQWQVDKGAFVGESGLAELYGQDGAEIGGQFERVISKQSYRGAYSGVKR